MPLDFTGKENTDGLLGQIAQVASYYADGEQSWCQGVWSLTGYADEDQEPCGCFVRRILDVLGVEANSLERAQESALYQALYRAMREVVAKEQEEIDRRIRLLPFYMRPLARLSYPKRRKYLDLVQFNDSRHTTFGLVMAVIGRARENALESALYATA